jgi:glucose/mannose transport system substrate-binding protein
MTRIQRSCKLSILTGVLTLALAACSAQASPSSGARTNALTLPTMAPNTVPAFAPATATSGEHELEIFDYWNGAGEVDAFNALVDVYHRQNPGVKFVYAPSSGSSAGADSFAVLESRLARGQPPDSWQLHAGKETLTYVIPGQLEPLTQFFHDQGLDKVMPPLLLDQLKINGEIYTVPLNIHRSNVLWYNPKLFQENNLKVPTTLADFFTVAQALKAKGITPLAVGDAGGFEVAALFESVLLATYGPEDYPKLFQGHGTLWTDPRTEAAIDTLKKMLDNANTDRSGTGWADQAQKVLDGKAAMTIMGGWVEGYYRIKGAKPNVDYGWAASPGTDGTFMWLSDSFGLARGAPHRAEAIAWLKTVGSKEGQDAFNPKKGSISARTDADTSLYDEYLQWSLDQFHSDKLVPSVVHGAAAPDAFKFAFMDALNSFSNDLDVKALNEALNAAGARLSP